MVLAPSWVFSFLNWTKITDSKRENTDLCLNQLTCLVTDKFPKEQRKRGKKVRLSEEFSAWF